MFACGIECVFFSLFSIFIFNVGSVVLLKASLAVFSDRITFQKNYAYRGAALMITDGSKV